MPRFQRDSSRSLGAFSLCSAGEQIRPAWKFRADAVLGEQVVEQVVPVVDAPLLRAEPGRAGGGDVLGVVVDEQDGRWFRADAPRGLGEEREVGLGGAQFP